MQTILLEIRAGEGGEDSKLFMKDICKMYLKYCTLINASTQCL